MGSEEAGTLPSLGCRAERSVLEPSATVLAINGSQVHWCVTHVLCVYCACSHRIPKQQVEQ